MSGRRRGWFCLVLLAACAADPARAQSSHYESEPNDTPAQANPVSGEVVLFGDLAGKDQDGYRWTVSDDDARRRWTFELHGVPGTLTVAELVRVEFADNGVDVLSYEPLMKMGTRDGVTPSQHADQLLEPGDYLLGIAWAGAPAKQGAGVYRPPVSRLSFGELGEPENSVDAATSEREPADSPEDAAADSLGAYRFVIRQGAPLNVLRNPGPAAERPAARVLIPGREFATFETEAVSWYRLDFDERAAGQRWDVEIRSPIGRKQRARLTDADGQTLVEGQADDHGRILFPDLAPQPGTWYVELKAPEPGFIQEVASRAVGQRVEGEEAEPNDRMALANRVDLERPLSGTLERNSATDWFRFPVDEALADQRVSLRLESDPPARMMFCLHTADGAQAQCRDAETPLELPGLLLAPGDWGLSLSRSKEDVAYSVTLVPQGPMEAGLEAEPNDTLDLANGVPDNLRIKGTFSGDDTDHYRVLVPSEPQLWRFQAIGKGIRELSYFDGGKERRAELRVPAGERRAQLDALFLLPGTHYLKIAGEAGGEYTLLARAMGPPDPNGEREPNDASNKLRLAMGQKRKGLLAESADIDHYRFFLAAHEHIRLTVEPPVDGQIVAQLNWYGEVMGHAGQRSAPGEALSLEGVFPPGDYELVLTPRQVSEGQYHLRLERLPRFACASDCEPSGMGAFHGAAPLPADLVLRGVTGDWRDLDVYRLPAFAGPVELLLRADAALPSLHLGPSSREKEALRFDATLPGYRGVVAAGPAQRLFVDSQGKPYELALEFPGGERRAATGALPVEFSLQLDATEVSAYRREGQRLDGSLSVNNTSSGPLELRLEAVASDHRWRLELDTDVLALQPGESATVPLRVFASADSWADRAVRISARAFDSVGRQQEAWQDVAVSRDAAAVHPFPYWPIPEALRGGFNAAWLPFGAGWHGQRPGKLGDAADRVRDGLVFPGTSIRYSLSDSTPGELTLDLPGDQPLPVAGLSLNHFGIMGMLDGVRQATLLLSSDGVEFEEALSFETLPILTEQHFVLEQPIPASHARLRVDANFSEGSPARISVAEWKLILQPGFDLSGGQGFNLADPALGGHVVAHAPAGPNRPDDILDAGNPSKTSVMRTSRSKDWVIGFHQNRAAQLDRIEWQYPEDTDARWKTFERVELHASVDSPVGPWVALGELDLAGGATDAALVFESPPWARFVRLRAHRGSEGDEPHAPGQVRIWERPGADDYRSILTEWGDVSPRAWYEAQNGEVQEPARVTVDHTARARAARLEPGTAVAGAVSLASGKSHWYALEVPAGDNLLTVELSGDPTVRTVLEVQDAAGKPLRLRRVAAGSSPARHRYEVVAEPGAPLWFRVTEPPRNVIFSWDTSPSVKSYIPRINNALVAFSSQVVPGREAVNLMPFPMSPLLKEWYGEPYILQSVLNDYRREMGSSSAEFTLKNAAQALAPLPGTKAIVVITDADSPHDGAMWEGMAAVQPRIFGIGVGGSERWMQHQFLDWAAVNGGHYDQLRYDGAMEVAFDRATTLMRRPAEYGLVVNSGFREAPGPGSLGVVAGKGGSPAGGMAVALILDASGSMLQRVAGKRRIDIAREVLTRAVTEHIPAGTPLSLRVFGHREPDACRSDLDIPLSPLAPAAAAKTLAGIRAMNLARTPIADSLAAVPKDLGGVKSAVIVLVTDGEETCDGDPAAVIERLRAQGLETRLNIVGFALDDDALAAQFEEWAALGGGRFFAAGDEEGLDAALQKALRIPFTVFDAQGAVVARGEVGGEPIELAAGDYRVEVASEPRRIFEQVEVQGEHGTILELQP